MGSDWITVPREPTEAMTHAGDETIIYHPEDIIRNQADAIWSAMLRAAPVPTPEATEAQVERGRAALEWLAAERTIEETLKGAASNEWLSASVERRIEMMGERKRAHDAAVLNARAAIAAMAPGEERIERAREALIAVADAMLKRGDGETGDYGWSITALNRARPLIRSALADLGGDRADPA